VASGQRVGYIRVSSVGQNPARQLDGVEVDRVFTDTVSGKSAARPQLQAMLAYVRDGDTVIVHSMGRLARNLDDLRRLVRELTGRGVAVQFIKEQLTFTAEDSPMATLLLSVLGAFAEFERALIRERQLEGIALAKARGAYTGRKPSLAPPARPRSCGPAPRRANPRRPWPASSASAARPSTSTCPRPRRRHRRPPGPGVAGPGWADG
jgi:DNA invertase Pin-like site-specific DNA recombinase